MACKFCGEVIQNKRNKEYCNKVCRNRAIAQKRDQNGERNPHWKGGRKIGSHGYWMILTDEGYVMEHRFIKEQELGRKLEDWEDVHHIDGNKHNNDPSNLEVLSRSEHMSHHAKEKMAWRKRDEKGRLI